MWTGYYSEMLLSLHPVTEPALICQCSTEGRVGETSGIEL